MPLTVISLCAYRTRRNGPWTDRDHAACKFIKAIKGRPVSGWAYVPVGSQCIRLDAENASIAPDLFAQQAVSSGIDWTRWGPLALVSIPDSACTVCVARGPRTLRLAAALAKHLSGAVVADVLRWSERRPPAHVVSGSRDPKQLFERLRLRNSLPPHRSIVIVDDVIASGAHVLATAAFLESHGAAIACVICAGRADDSPTVNDAFATRIDLIQPMTEDLRAGARESLAK